MSKTTRNRNTQNPEVLQVARRFVVVGQNLEDELNRFLNAPLEEIQNQIAADIESHLQLFAYLYHQLRKCDVIADRDEALVLMTKAVRLIIDRDDWQDKAVNHQ